MSFTNAKTTTAEIRAAIDPNDEMLTEDENEDKRREFGAIIWQRAYRKRMDELGAKASESLDYWDGVHLSEAIEKTTGAALQPQAMWRN